MSIQTIKYQLIIILILLLSATTLNSQNFFTGRIKYEITYPGSIIDQATLEQLPSEALIVAKNNMVRTDMQAGVLKQTKIANAENRNVSTLLEILREEYVMHKTYQDIQANIREMAEVEIEFTNDTREILGYECKKAKAVIYDQFGDKIIIDIFYTEEIHGEPFNFDLPYNQIPGLMLVYEIRSGSLNMRYEAKSIKSRWGMFVSDRNFRIPREAKDITFEELQEILK